MTKTKILYVEDEPFLGKIVKESLESRNFAVEMVKDGNLVMDTFLNFQPNICVLDVMLPNKDGFTVGKEINAVNPSLPIIYLTAKNQTADLLEGFKSGGNDYIKKPFSMEELIVRIENLIQLSQASVANPVKQQAIHFGNFTFYPLKYQLSSKQCIQQLSHRETELLKIFSKNQNQPVQRKAILLHIWGDDSYFNSRNLDVYIKKLRNYLATDPHVRIVTLKGVGYLFSVE